MTIWITSDIHLNHRNILLYCPHRGGPEVTDENVNRMNEKIISNWNSKKSDVAMGLIDKAPALIRRLNGDKMLIKGNHDVNISKRVNRGDEGFGALFLGGIHDYYEMSYKTSDTGRKVLINMSHYPMHSWNGMNQGTIMLHGHLHGTPHGISGRIKDVGMDTNNLFPYKLDDVVNKLLAIEVIRDHHGKEM
jgi:calcineurin-like phosphoesterase family protein